LIQRIHIANDVMQADPSSHSVTGTTIRGQEVITGTCPSLNIHSRVIHQTISENHNTHIRSFPADRVNRTSQVKGCFCVVNSLDR
jgi:hypothetical protein